MNNTFLASLLPGMHYFVCAAQHLSFTEAANALNVTQGAVSHRIRQLEDQLGFPLFRRFSKKVALTGEGERLLAILSAPLFDLENEVRNIRHFGLTGSLVLHCPPSLAGVWLLPRLRLFQKAFPGITVHVRCRNDLVDLETESVDIAIAYGTGPYPGTETVPLMKEWLMPVCSPEYAQRHNLEEAGLAGLGGCTLLHDNTPWPNAQYYSEWQTWAAFMGLHDLDTNSGYSFDRSELAAMAAKQGIGVAMGRKMLICDDVAAGLLVPLCKTEMEAPQRYFIVLRKEDRQRPRIRSFVEWLISVAHGEKEGEGKLVLACPMAE